MEIASLLLPTVAGYIFLVLLTVTKYRILRSTGYNVAFLSAAVGLALYAASLFLLSYFGDSPFPRTSQELSSFAISGSLLSFSFASLVPLLVNVTWLLSSRLSARLPTDHRWHGFIENPDDYGARRAAELAADGVELLLHRAVQDRRHVQLTLRSGKVYVGTVVSTGLARRGDSPPDVSIDPVVSGYRDTASQELNLVTDYDWVDPKRHGGITVVLPLDEILLARIFDLSGYRNWLLVQNALVDLEEIVADPAALAPDQVLERLHALELFRRYDIRAATLCGSERFGRASELWAALCDSYARKTAPREDPDADSTLEELKRLHEHVKSLVDSEPDAAGV